MPSLLPAPTPTGRTIVALAALAVLAPRGAALIEFDEGRNQIGVTATYGIAYDSNVFVRAGGAGDSSQVASLGADYNRRAGLIGVHAAAAVAVARYVDLTAENYTNPSFSVDLTKDQGRLTGSAGLSVRRDSRSDAAANVRATSWNYGATLNARYPINERYYFTSATGFSLQDYVDNPGLFNLSSYSEAVDIFYAYTSKLDLLGGYRIRRGAAEGGTHTLDQAVTAGASGSVLAKLNGSIRLGYQWRDENGAQGRRYDALTTSLALAWPVNKRVLVSAAASKDFTTTATDISVDTTAFSLSANLKPALKVKLVLDAGVEYSTSDFLGLAGGGRRDHAWTWNAGVSAPLFSKVSAALAYTYTDNGSNIAFSQFARYTVTCNLSVRF